MACDEDVVPLQLVLSARYRHAAFKKSATAPKTSLDKDKLETILGGTAEVADQGVVIVSIPRKETIILDGVLLKSEMGVSHTIAFEPLPGWKRTTVAPDVALIVSEMNPHFFCQCVSKASRSVVSTTRRRSRARSGISLTNWPLARPMISRAKFAKD
jgi:hypothetical protein